MEARISDFCETLASFLHHVQSSTKSLASSIQTRPIPLDSVASSFLRQLDVRVSSAAADLELLESMAFGTVSFEELLGHYGEVYKMNQAYISQIEERLQEFGYVPDVHFDDENGEDDLDSNLQTVQEESAHVYDSKALNERHLFDESLSLRELGLSDVCLATLASKARNDGGVASEHLPSGNVHTKDLVSSSTHGVVAPGELKDHPSTESSTKYVLNVSQDDYDCLPSYLKNLASWKELLEAVGKMNSELWKRDGASGSCTFTENDLEPLELGNKARAYLLLLLRMKILTLETVGGSAMYRVVGDQAAF